MASTSTFEAGPLPERADFVKMEEKVIAQWKAIDAFKTQLKLSEGKPEVSPCGKRKREATAASGWFS